MPRDTDRPDPYISAPLGPPVRQAAPAPAPAPSKQPQPGAMDVSDIGMIMRDCTPKPAKPSKLNEQQRADWLRMSAESAPTREPQEAFWFWSQGVPDSRTFAELWADPNPTAPLHPRRHLDWPVIDPDMIKQAPRRRAAWLPEGE
jgi:hypothetical protein